jgi:hypothetical protein
MSGTGASLQSAEAGRWPRTQVPHQALALLKVADVGLGVVETLTLCGGGT